MKLALDFQSPVVAQALTLVIKAIVGIEPTDLDQADVVICDSVARVGKQLENPARQVVLLLPHSTWLQGPCPTNDRLRVFFVVEDVGQPSTLDLLAWLKTLREPPAA